MSDRLRLLRYALLVSVVGFTLSLTPHASHATPFTDLIAAMNEGDWAKANTNHYWDVWTPVAQRPASNNPGSIIRAWSSFAWDSERDQIILWGGGHANYPGNEVYTWQSSTLEWTRASLPSAIRPLNAPNAFETVDGPQHSPISSHTYDNQEYLSVADRFITFGGAAYNTGDRFMLSDNDDWAGFTGPYLWDPSKADGGKVGGLTGSHINLAAHPGVLGGEMWENRDAGIPDNLSFVNGATDAVVENGKDVVYVNPISGDNGTLMGLYKYTVNDIGNPAADTWQQIGAGNPAQGSFSGSGALDVDRNLFVRSLGGAFVYWDLNEAGLATAHTFTPDFIDSGFAGIGGYGVEWDPERGWFVVWTGNGDVWYLKPPAVISTSGWTMEKAPDPGVALTPHASDASIFTGVLGKWKYIDEHDVFVGLVDDLLGDIWIYKPVSWAGLGQPGLPGEDDEEVREDPVIAAPEPGSILILAGALGLMAVRRFRRQPRH